MSSNYLQNVILPENIIRDFAFSATAAAGDIYDTPQEFGALGLDLFIRNRGAAAITIAINGQAAITVDPGDVYTLNGVMFWLVTVVAAVQYDLQVFGVRVNTLKKRGII